MKRMFRSIILMLVTGLSMVILTGCSNPQDTVTEFLTAIQKGDHKTASTYVEAKNDGYDFNNLDKTQNGMDGKALFNAIAQNYKFENVEKVSEEGDTAKIKVKITSVDMSIAFTKTIGEFMPLALANAFNENQQSGEAEEQMMMTMLMKNLSDKDATTATREVTFNLKKDKEGNYKIISDENLQEAILANAKAVDKMFKEEKQ